LLSCKETRKYLKEKLGTNRLKKSQSRRKLPKSRKKLRKKHLLLRKQLLQSQLQRKSRLQRKHQLLQPRRKRKRRIRQLKSLSKKRKRSLKLNQLNKRRLLPPRLTCHSQQELAKMTWTLRKLREEAHQSQRLRERKRRDTDMTHQAVNALHQVMKRSSFSKTRKEMLPRRRRRRKRCN